ncbi:unnamed protein product [Urochloa humidicola]
MPLSGFCSCDATSISSETGKPAWKLGEEKVFSEDPAETHGEEKEELRTKRFRARYYNVPSKTSIEFLHHERQGPVAFWL